MRMRKGYVGLVSDIKGMCVSGRGRPPANLEHWDVGNDAK